MTRKVKRVSVRPWLDGGEIWDYQVNWTGSATFTKEAVDGPTNLDLETAYAQELWNEFLGQVGVRGIEQDLRELETKLRYLRVAVPLTERDTVISAESQLSEVFATLERMRDVGETP